MKKTKIVCTIGPASDNPIVLEKLIKSGMDVMRLNFSHGTHEEHLKKIKTLQELNKKLNRNVAFLIDTKGPEIRTGDLENDIPQPLIKGDTFTLTTRDIIGNDEIVSVSYKNLPNDITVGSHILIDDGLIDLIVDSIDETDIHCTVQNTGILGSKKGINLPGTKLALKSMTDKDKDDIKFAVNNNFDYIAASFVRKPEDVIEIREYLKELNNDNIKIISKIENKEGIDNFDEILKVSDGIMVARGDLGVEIPIEDVPSVQKQLIKKCVNIGKPVITATQMLESMQKNPRPTRAEVSDVANAVYDGTSAVMLSGESAKGEYPVESVQIMNKIVSKAEENINYWKRFKNKNIERLTTDYEGLEDDEYEFKKRVNFAACCNAMFSGADAIIAITDKGVTPRFLSSFKPACPIYVITANLNTYRQMNLLFNVTAVYVENEYDFEKILNKGIDIFKSMNLLKENDTVILSGGFPQKSKLNVLNNQATGTIIKL